MKGEIQVPLIIPFFLGAILLCLQGVYPIPCLAFAPWIAWLVLSTPHPKALWLAALSGAFFDLFTDDPMGLHAINYTLAALVSFPLRNYFLSERPLHLSLFTALISWLTSFFQWLLLFLFDRRPPFAGEWIFLDWIGMCGADALYALLWFAAPLTLIEKLRRQWVLFWLKKKNPSLN